MYCRHCAAENPDEASFCRSCGKQIAAASTDREQPWRRAPDERREARRPGLIYPSEPPKSKHWALLGFLITGVGQMVFGQVAKGATLLAVSIVLGMFLLAALGDGAVVVTIAFGVVMLVDAYMVGGRLGAGRPVGRWEFFPRNEG